MVQKRNKIVNALAKADIELTIFAAFSAPPPNKMKNRPSNIKNGAPGGWPTSNLKDVVMNSPQSQKLTVGSIVSK